MNFVVHAYSSKRGVHAQPFVVCQMHLRAAELDYTNGPNELRLLGETDAQCFQCYKRDRVVAPLEILEAFYLENETAYVQRLFVLARALGYESLDDAFLQLAIQRKLQSEDMALMGG